MRLLAAAIQVFVAAEGPIGTPTDALEATERQVVKFVREGVPDTEAVRPAALAGLAENAATLAVAADALAAGIQAYQNVELQLAQDSLSTAIDSFTRTGAALWREPGLGRAHLFMALTLSALGSSESEVQGHFMRALRVDPSLDLEVGTYSPALIQVFRRARRAAVEAGVRPEMPVVWGQGARRLGASRLLLIRLTSGNQVTLRLFRLDGQGGVADAGRQGPLPREEAALKEGIGKLFGVEEAKPPLLGWKQWAAIGGGAALAAVATGFLLSGGGQKVDVTVVPPP